MAGQGTASVEGAQVAGYMLWKEGGLHKGLQSQAHQLSVTHRKASETILLQQGKCFTAVTFAVQTPA